MIGEAEIRARASRLGLLPSHIEKDYVLNHVLVSIADADVALSFRGGTALARVYWPDFRLSEDLDFITSSSLSDLVEALEGAVRRASESTGIRLRLEHGTAKDGWRRSSVRWEDGVLTLDVNSRERVSMPIHRQPLILPYSDLTKLERAIDVVALEEILGNKCFMLADRREPRDLYDLWAGLCRFDVALDSVARGFRAKYGYGMKAWQLERAESLRDDWLVRLSNQVAHLPPFEEAVEAIRGKVAEWERRSRS